MGRGFISNLPAWRAVYVCARETEAILSERQRTGGAMHSLNYTRSLCNVCSTLVYLTLLSQPPFSFATTLWLHFHPTPCHIAYACMLYNKYNTDDIQRSDNSSGSCLSVRSQSVTPPRPDLKKTKWVLWFKHSFHNRNKVKFCI